jgi:hypothetical protein
MVYIHDLPSLTPKSAEIESVYILREIKQKTTFPFPEQHMADEFSAFFISDTDKTIISESIDKIEPTIRDIRELFDSGDKTFEALNLKRAMVMLTEIPKPLSNNLLFIGQVAGWQETSPTEITAVLNSIPKLRTSDEKIACNNMLNHFFMKILRNSDMKFNTEGIVGDAEKARLADLHESMGKGFFFHVTLEEELKKLKFDAIQGRIPKDKLQKVESIAKNVAEIKKGVDRSYEINMRMVQWSVLLYTYIKWAMSQK